MCWDTSSRSFSWKNTSEALEGFDGDQYDDGFYWCSTMRWNQCLMGWGEWPLEALDEFWLMCSMRCHIHAWNMAWGDWLKRDLAQSIYGWVEHGSSISSWFISFINEKKIFPWFSYANVLMYIWIFMVDIFIVFMFLLCFLICTFIPEVVPSGIRACFKHLD